MAIDFRTRDFFYPLGILRLKRTLERTQWLSPDEIKTYQEKRLTIILEQAFNHVPHYRRLFADFGLKLSDIRCIDDLKKLPVLSKHTLKNHRKDLTADNASRYRPVVYKTSGTTGTPLELLLDHHARILEFVYYWRHWSWAGYCLGDRFAELGSVYFLNRNRLNDKISVWQPHLGRLMLNSSQISVRHTKKFAKALEKYRPKFLKGSASTVYFFAYCMKELGITNLSFKAIFSANEVLTPPYRALAESVFNCPVLDSYGHMEGTVAVSQCLQGGYHINSDYGILEYGDQKLAADGSTILCRAIGTSLYNLAMPLIRYDVGDDIERFPEPKTCPCGRTLPLVKAVHGRSEDTIVTPDGRFITSMYIVPEILDDARFVQFIQHTEYSLNVNVVPAQSWHVAHEEKLARYVKKLVGKEMTINIRMIGENEIIEDASGKIRTVISEVSVED
ncbi:phenylacetate--CoA ligase family protein [Thermodesulfobacteriota bacterium]